MSEIIKQEFRTDAAGMYIAYVYDDGHTETDPIGRPLSKEDLQRKMRDDEALARAKSTLVNERARVTGRGALGSSPNAQQIARAEFDIIAGGLLTRDFNDMVRKLSEFAPTATATSAQVDTVVGTVSLGGEVVGGNAIEFIPMAVRATPESVTGRGFTVARSPVELRPGHSDA
jgi:hypothetical protein